jgi:hypothetical protein
MIVCLICSWKKSLSIISFNFYHQTHILSILSLHASYLSRACVIIIKLYCWKPNIPLSISITCLLFEGLWTVIRFWLSPNGIKVLESLVVFWYLGITSTCSQLGQEPSDCIWSDNVIRYTNPIKKPNWSSSMSWARIPLD